MIYEINSNQYKKSEVLMPKSVSMTDLRFRLKEVIAEILKNGKPVTVKRHKKKLVRIVPVSRKAGRKS